MPSSLGLSLFPISPRSSRSLGAHTPEERRSPASCGQPHPPKPLANTFLHGSSEERQPPAFDRRETHRKDRYGAPWNQGEESNIGSIPCGGFECRIWGYVNPKPKTPNLWFGGFGFFLMRGSNTCVCVCGGVTVSNKTKILFLGFLSLLFRLNGCWKSTVRGGSGV
jgi:hypothetical protein